MKLSPSLSLLLLGGSIAEGSIIVTSQTSLGTALPYSALVSNDDLINAGQSSLLSASVSATAGGFPGSGINDGLYTNTSTNNAFFETPGHFPATATFTLDTSSAPWGYDITSIDSFMGWVSGDRLLANQIYSVEVSFHYTSLFSPLLTVSRPDPLFGAVSDSNVESHVRITQNNLSGILAAGVDQIRFTFSDPDPLNLGGINGTIVREIDIQGLAAVPEATESLIFLCAGSGLLLGCRRRKSRTA
jgi:hypothetical protein